jgi:hypothetical protein
VYRSREAHICEGCYARLVREGLDDPGRSSAGAGGEPDIAYYGCGMVAHRTITLAQEGAAIVVRARATTPTPLTGSTAWSTAARAGYTGRCRIRPGPWSILAGR